MALFVLTATYVLGALFAKHKLESFRDLVQDRAESMTGVRVNAGAVVVDSLHGLRIDDLEIALGTPVGRSVRATIPVTFIYINWLDLLSGTISVERVQLDGAEIHVSGVEEGGGAGLAPIAFQEGEGRGLARSFRVLGKQCTLRVDDVLGDAPLFFDDVQFDVSRLPEATDVTAKISGNLDGDVSKGLTVDVLRFGGMEDFEVRVQCGEMRVEDVAAFVPMVSAAIVSGAASANVGVTRYPDQTFSVSVEAPFRDLEVRGQPDYVGRLAGTFSVQAKYDVGAGRVDLVTAKLDSEPLGGALDGSIVFEAGIPRFDLRLTTTSLPFEAMLADVAERYVTPFGAVALETERPIDVIVGLSGTLLAPEISVFSDLRMAEISFVPKDGRYPSARLKCRTFEATWDAETRTPRASLTLWDSEVHHAASGISAGKISGVLALDWPMVRVAPANAEIAGQPVMAEGEYDLERKRGRVTLSGQLARLEDTALGTSIRNTTLRGSASLRRFVATVVPGKVTVEGEMDLSQAQIDYSWWFRKPAGLGAHSTFRGEILPRKSMGFDLSSTVAGTRLEGRYDFGYDASRKRKWKLMTSSTRASEIDAVTLGRCLRIPYTITSGMGSEGHFDWTREAESGDGAAWRAQMMCRLREITLVPDGGGTPMYGKGVLLEAWVTKSANPTGRLSLVVEEASMPAFGGVWFHPLRKRIQETAPDLMERFPPVDRSWTFSLASGTLELPPWKGTEFTGEGFFTTASSGLTAYGAKVGEGRIDGSYTLSRSDNVYETSASWTDIPSVYILRHLGYPEVLRGPITGNVTYTMDRDDPRTIQGEGAFSIRDGHFNADFIIAQLDDQRDALPRSFAFSRLSASVRFDGDRTDTRDLELVGDGLRMTGSGYFVSDGDMDYDLKVAISPEVAREIPVLRDNFNVSGHQMAKQDIELAFKVDGPKFDPRWELSGLPPPSVTFTSGVLEVTRDIIDFPRKILTSLLKMGGGLAGPPR